MPGGAERRRKKYILDMSATGYPAARSAGKLINVKIHLFLIQKPDSGWKSFTFAEGPIIELKNIIKLFHLFNLSPSRGLPELIDWA